MPCYGPDGPPNTRSDKAEGLLHITRKDLDDATRAACEALKLLFNIDRNANALLSNHTQKWYKQHQILDRSRERRRSK